MMSKMKFDENKKFEFNSPKNLVLIFYHFCAARKNNQSA
jgi:hypothetical protein